VFSAYGDLGCTGLSKSLSVSCAPSRPFDWSPRAAPRKLSLTQAIVSIQPRQIRVHQIITGLLPLSQVKRAGGFRTEAEKPQMSWRSAMRIRFEFTCRECGEDVHAHWDTSHEVPVGSLGSSPPRTPSEKSIGPAGSGPRSLRRFCFLGGVSLDVPEFPCYKQNRALGDGSSGRPTGFVRQPSPPPVPGALSYLPKHNLHKYIGQEVYTQAPRVHLRAEVPRSKLRKVPAMPRIIFRQVSVTFSVA